MARPICLFTGQWADLPLETMAAKAKEFGYDGLELACWGDHFEVQRALEEDDYCARKWELLQDAGVLSFALSSHLVGQAVCDRIDERHEQILTPRASASGPPRR
jgi:sugar phosphate isomerase/epimerase